MIDSEEWILKNHEQLKDQFIERHQDAFISFCDKAYESKLSEHYDYVYEHLRDEHKR